MNFGAASSASAGGGFGFDASAGQPTGQPLFPPTEQRVVEVGMRPASPPIAAARDQEGM